MLFDKANSKDPNKEYFEGKEYPKELLYSKRLSEKLNDFVPNSSEALGLAIHCQHICRWEIPRDTYEMNRVGYLKWRKELNVFHAERAGEILNSIEYNGKVIEDVQSLLLKKSTSNSNDNQILEDVVCLVFIEHSLSKFSEKYPEEKLISIISKTWNKMSEKGQEAALKLELDSKVLELISKSIK